MKNPVVASILFHCPQCKENFEFDHVGEDEFVRCPICETNYVTVRAGNKLKLEAAEQALLC
jgi:Zn finger protein HypA/HybF involved in hydrogenase expression